VRHRDFIRRSLASGHLLFVGDFTVIVCHSVDVSTCIHNIVIWKTHCIEMKNHLLSGSHFHTPPLNRRRHRSNDDCLEGKREIIRFVLCSIVCNSCSQCSARVHIHVNRPNSLTVLWVWFWFTGTIHFVCVHFVFITICYMLYYCNMVRGLKPDL